MVKHEEKIAIENFIQNEDYKEAWNRLNEYKLKYKNDIKCYSLEGLLHIVEGNISKANKILLEAYVDNKIDYDILYQLGMVSEIKEDKFKAIEYYSEANKINNNEVSIEKLNIIINDLVCRITDDVIDGKETTQKFFNILNKLNSDLNLDKHLKNIVVNKYPKNIIIETIRGCNLECVFCPLQVDENVKEHGLMSKKTFNKILNNVIPIDKIKLFIMHNLGEPLLDKSIFEKVTQIKKLRSDSEVLIDSNLSIDFDAFEMVKSGLDILDVAFDGATQKSYEKYRVNGNLDKLIANIVKIATAKKILNVDKPIINAKTVMFKPIIQDMNLIPLIAARAGANQYVLQTAIFRDETDEDPKDWIPEKQELTRYDVEKLYNKNKLTFYKNNFKEEKNCSGILEDIPPVIDFKGNVYPCCYCCTHEEYNMGNINDKSFEEIWKSDKYVEFRMEVFKNRYKHNICSKCYRVSNQS